MVPADTALTESTEIHVSTTFFPAAVLPGVLQGQKCDLVIQTSDFVFFYCHKSILLSKSSNNFGALIPVTVIQEEVVTTTETSTEEGTIHQQQLRSVSQLFAVTVPEIATVFNIVLHVIYGLEFRRYGPSLTIMSEALISLAKYGAPPLQTGSEMYTLLAKAIDTQPLQVYAIGAYWNLEAVCLAASEKTLGLSLSMLSEADAIMTGPLYLRRLFFLHLGRISALQRVTESPPEEHPDHPGCTGAQREPLRKLWRAGRATLLMRELPQNASVQDVVLIFGSLIGETTCLDCKAKVHARVGRLVQDWSRVKRTI